MLLTEWNCRFLQHQAFYTSVSVCLCKNNFANLWIPEDEITLFKFRKAISSANSTPSLKLLNCRCCSSHLGQACVRLSAFSTGSFCISTILSRMWETVRCPGAQPEWTLGCPPVCQMTWWMSLSLCSSRELSCSCHSSLLKDPMNLMQLIGSSQAWQQLCTSTCCDNIPDVICCCPGMWQCSLLCLHAAAAEHHSGNGISAAATKHFHKFFSRQGWERILWSMQFHFPSARGVLPSENWIKI